MSASQEDIRNQLNRALDALGMPRGDPDQNLNPPVDETAQPSPFMRGFQRAFGQLPVPVPGLGAVPARTLATGAQAVQAAAQPTVQPSVTAEETTRQAPPRTGGLRDEPVPAGFERVTGLPTQQQVFRGVGEEGEPLFTSALTMAREDPSLVASGQLQLRPEEQALLQETPEQTEARRFQEGMAVRERLSDQLEAAGHARIDPRVDEETAAKRAKAVFDLEKARAQAAEARAKAAAAADPRTVEAELRKQQRLEAQEDRLVRAQIQAEREEARQIAGSVANRYFAKPGVFEKAFDESLDDDEREDHRRNIREAEGRMGRAFTAALKDPQMAEAAATAFIASEMIDKGISKTQSGVDKARPKSAKNMLRAVRAAKRVAAGGNPEKVYEGSLNIEAIDFDPDLRQLLGQLTNEFLDQLERTVIRQEGE